jgi:cysteinyl-tRNA synthetase
VDEYEKDSARDFALWKAPKPGEHKWDTALGPGRPGWHIECSAMAMEYLGDSFDLHAGGEDLMFPHHENEIAQSESASHQPFARHWFHVRFLLVEGKKMAKSEGNFYTLRDLLLRGYKASAIRMLLISVPYRQQLNFTFEGLAAETVAVERLRNFRDRVTKTQWPKRNAGNGTHSEVQDYAQETRAKFLAGLADDLNTAEARAAIFEMVRFVNAKADAGLFFADDVPAVLAVLREFDRVFSVIEDHDAKWTAFTLEWAEKVGRLGEASPEVLATRGVTDADIEALIAERTQAKKTRNFARADAIRNELAAKGILLEDSKDGVRWKRK